MTNIETLHHAQSALVDSLNATGEQLERLGGHELTLAVARVQMAAEQAKARMTAAVEQMHQVLADVLDHVQALTRGICRVIETPGGNSPFPSDDTPGVEPPVEPTPTPAPEPAIAEATSEPSAPADAVESDVEAPAGTPDEDTERTTFVDNWNTHKTPAPTPEVVGPAEIVTTAANTCVADPDTLSITPEDTGRPARRKGKSRR